MTYSSFTSIEQEIKEMIESNLERTGLLYRIYSRIKSNDSISEKIKRKGYAENEKQIQDFIGIRVMTYFGEDIEILINYFSSIFDIIDLEQDKMDMKSFSPVRINLVCRMHGKQLKEFEARKSYYSEELNNVDSTFEIQIRTTLSEGWHEIEHNMRYKCKSEWNSLEDESMVLNGIHATLVTSDHTISKLFEEIAYQHYKARNWTAMLRNKFRLRFDASPLSPAIASLFDEDKELAKCFYKIKRNKFIYEIISHNLYADISFDNVIYLANYLYVKNEEIFKITPIPLQRLFDETFTSKADTSLSNTAYAMK